MTTDNSGEQLEAGSTEQPAEKGVGNRLRRWWIVAGSVAVVLLIASGIAIAVVKGGWGSGVSASDTTSHQHNECRDLSPAASGATESEPSPAKDAVTIVDRVVTPTPELGATAEETGWVAFGAMLRNDSDLIAYGVDVRFTATWPDGTEVRNYDKNSWKYEPKTVKYLPPGEELGLGNMMEFYNENQGDDPKFKLHVEVDVREWWDSDNAVHESKPVTGKFVGRATLDGGPKIGFSAVSENCDPIRDPFASVVYRDKHGDMIGAYSGLNVIATTDGLPDDRDHADNLTPGTKKRLLVNDVWSEHLDQEHEFGAEADLSKTSIYPYAILGEANEG